MWAKTGEDDKSIRGFIVLDHFGRSPAAEGTRSASFQTLLRLLSRENCWAKIMGVYFVSERYPRFDDIDLLESRGNSNYNALQARFQQRLFHGLTSLASYTWSKSIDDASNFFSSAGSVTVGVCLVGVGR